VRECAILAGIKKPITPQKCSLPLPISKEETVRALDTKFIKGELPYDVYIRLRSEYATESSSSKKGKNGQSGEDVAYR
jgi:hypothetical protein